MRKVKPKSPNLKMTYLKLLNYCFCSFKYSNALLKRLTLFKCNYVIEICLNLKHPHKDMFFETRVIQTFVITNKYKTKGKIQVFLH